MQKRLEEGVDRRVWLAPAVSFFVTASVVLVAFALGSFAPFGTADNSLASMDGFIQYRDFFAWYKDLLAGNNDIAYSFSKMLGGGYTAVFSYYLSSPLNLLVVFFDKADLRSFFDLIALLKLTLASASFSVLVQGRFAGRVSLPLNVLLSCGYGLMAYTTGQASNIMWLDGVYMLPLMVLGVWRVVSEGSFILLTVSTALSLLFNWYSGAINCLFSGVFLVFEALHAVVCDGFVPKRVARAVGWYAVAMGLGVMMSAALFYPTVRELSGGRGQLDLDLIAPVVSGLPKTFFSSFVIGVNAATPQMSVASLFCGSVATVGCILLLSDGSRPLAERVLFVGFFGVMASLLYFQPLVALLSLLKSVSSYWYRYAYGVTLAFPYAAGFFYARGRAARPRPAVCAVLMGLVCLAMAVGVVRFRVTGASQTAVSLAFAACALAALAAMRLGASERVRACACMALCVVALVELGYGTSVQFTKMAGHGGLAADEMSSELEHAASELRGRDAGAYRVQSLYRRASFAFNDGAAYGYASVSGYTSDPDDLQRAFLDKVGYRVNGENTNITSQLNLGADSLLGVKYYVIPESWAATYGDPSELGLVATGITTEHLAVWENPFALPLAVEGSATSGATDIVEGDSFATMNALYSELLGEDVEVFRPLEAPFDETASGTAFDISAPAGGRSVLYGDVSCAYQSGVTLDANGAELPYATWGSPSVFLIPWDGSSATVPVSLKGENLGVSGYRFYALDLDELSRVSARLQERAPEHLSVEDGQVDASFESDSAGNLFLSVPTDDNWGVTVNGSEGLASSWGGALYRIPHATGDSTVSLTYRVPGLRAGVAASALGVMALVCVSLVRRRLCAGAYHGCHKAEIRGGGSEKGSR